MFEKEGIKYALEETIGTECLSKPIEDFSFIDLADEQQEKAQCFKDGAEFGYNKANEWHKPSEKLPERCSLVLAYAFDDTEPSLYQFVTNDQWEWMPRRIAFLSNDQIRLWKEIVLPKEIKEND